MIIRADNHVCIKENVNLKARFAKLKHSAKLAEYANQFGVKLKKT